jgi:hypothetical protein
VTCELADNCLRDSAQEWAGRDLIVKVWSCD